MPKMARTSSGVSINSGFASSTTPSSDVFAFGFEVDHERGETARNNYSQCSTVVDVLAIMAH